MVIDGLDAEWQGEALNTDDDGMADYALRNDGAHLYLLFVIKDPKFLSSINATGLTVYLSPEGKKSKDHGLRFIRRPVPAEQLIASMEKSGELLTEEKKAEMRAKKFYLVFQCEVIDKNPDKKAAATDMESRLTGDLESIDMESGGPSGYSRSPKKYSFWADVKLAGPSR